MSRLQSLPRSLIRIPRVERVAQHHRRAAVMGLTLVIAVSAGLGTLRAPQSTPAVYSVKDVVLGLRRQPARWLGHTILIRGAIAAWGATMCPTTQGVTTAPICRSQKRWVYLGPVTISAGLVIPNLAPVPAMSGWGSGSYYNVKFSPLLSTVATPSSSILVVLLRPGRSSLAPLAHGGLPPELVTLPLVGTVIDWMFPPDYRVTARIQIQRSAAQTCAVTASAPCSDGLLLAP